jgi:hypothetical protein
MAHFVANRCHTPAWPKNWDAEFKLHAPYETTVEGRIARGKLVDLKVTPEVRKADVTIEGKTSD